MKSCAWGVVLTAGFAMWAGQAAAQDYPTRPVELIVPFNTGGSADGSARPLAQALSEELGQQFVVDNRPGAQSVIGAASVVGSEPDGYTLLYAAGGTILSPYLVADMTFDPLKDMTPITLVNTFPYVLIAGANAPVGNFEEMLSFAKENPGKLTIGASDPVTTANINLMLEELGVEMTVVNYTGGGPTLTDLIGGHLDLALVGAGAYLPRVGSGQVVGIAATSEGRLESLSDLPTLVELGYEGLVIDSFYALTGPTGMSDEVVAKLQAAVKASLDDPSDPLRDQLVKLGFDIPEEYTAEAAMAKFTQYSERMGAVFEKLGVKPE